ncbi:MAG TPA: hypothetical protein VF759_09970 [Allosphingosinicella sp.]|jgi:hypothetical protein
MKIVRLKPGERAPDDSDRIIVNSLPNGRHGVTGVTANRRSRPEAVTMITPNALASDGEAEAAGIRWAMQHPIDVLYVERPV